jgi:prolycopene isomerase
MTVAALLAKRGLDVTVVEQQDRPGGACSAFRRGDVTYDSGAAMLFGFGPHGFNPHNWLMSELGIEIDMYRHEALYRLYYGDVPITFHYELDLYLDELSSLFPRAAGQIRDFYVYIEKLYKEVIAPVSLFEAPGDMPLSEMRKNMKSNLLSQARMIKLLFTSTNSLMKKFIKDEETRRYFDKLTSTYSYTTIEETPAILAATMFVDNHAGGAYYPAGSAMALAARLEKSIEKNGGRFVYRTKVAKILGGNGQVVGVETSDGRKFLADAIVFSGSLMNFARNLDPEKILPNRWKHRILGQELTMPSFVVYGTVERSVLPAETLPVQMYIDNRENLDDSDVTMYLPSLEDPTLAPEDVSTFLLIGPSLEDWPVPTKEGYADDSYAEKKKREADRMIALVDKRIPGFVNAIKTRIEGSPTTIWRYLGKTNGAVAGIKQKMGQHLMFRQGSKGPVAGLYFAGESTVMGTGTPAVTVSGISVANRILRESGREPYRGDAPNMDKSAVRIIPAGVAGNRPKSELGILASRCLWCDNAPCAKACSVALDIPGLMRRLEAGNLSGAAKLVEAAKQKCEKCFEKPGLAPCEAVCVQNASKRGGEGTAQAGVGAVDAAGPVAIRSIVLTLTQNANLEAIRCTV